MKSRYMTTKSVENALWEDVCTCINGNGLLMFIAVQRATGWGQKRMERFMQTYNDVQAEFHEYEVQGIFDIMAERELSAMGLDMHEILPKPIDFRNHKRNMRRMDQKLKAPVPKAEAEEMYRKLTGFKGYVESLKTEVQNG